MANNNRMLKRHFPYNNLGSEEKEKCNCHTRQKRRDNRSHRICEIEDQFPPRNGIAVANRNAGVDDAAVDANTEFRGNADAVLEANAAPDVIVPGDGRGMGMAPEQLMIFDSWHYYGFGKKYYGNLQLKYKTNANSIHSPIVTLCCHPICFILINHRFRWIDLFGHWKTSVNRGVC